MEYLAANVDTKDQTMANDCPSKLWNQLQWSPCLAGYFKIMHVYPWTV